MMPNVCQNRRPYRTQILISILGIPSIDSRHNRKCNSCAFHKEIHAFEDWIFVRLSSLVLASEWTTNRNRGSTVGFLLPQCFSELLDTPGISRCRLQHVSVQSSSLFHHSIYLWFICFPWWSIDELENLHADRTTVCFEPWQKPRARLDTRKTGLSPPQYFNTDRSKAVLLLWFLTVTCSCCPYLYFGSAIMLVTYFVNYR